jgi:hypothetical protein
LHAKKRNWRRIRAAGDLKQIRELVDRKLDIAQDGTQQTRTDRFTGMHRNCSGSAVGVSEKDVTPAGSVHGEACSFEGTDEFFSLEARKARHTETC